MNPWKIIKNYWNNPWPRKYSGDMLPPQKMREALTLPWVRETMVQFSLDEYERNPYYASVINKQAEQTIGPCPTMIAGSEVSSDNDTMENAHQEWTQMNMIGRSLREFRKQAALTGLAIALPEKKETVHPVKLGYKIYGFDALENPLDIDPESRIFDGIEYDEDWNPIRFYFRNEEPGEEPVPYEAKDLIYWSRGYKNGKMTPIPECVAGFTVYPFIRRYLQASIEAAEFRTSFPMALELDKDIYRASEGMKLQKLEKMRYEPRTVPTLPVGTTLKGLPLGASSEQTEKMVRVMAAACALCIDMPANLALGDSSNSNMASAQVDMQPWKNHVNIDRFDMLPVMRKMFDEWYKRASLIRGLTPPSSRDIYKDFFPHTYVYDPLFQHPDPLKNANACTVGLVGGFKTLNEVYSEMGKNPRRELETEARLMGITYEELMQIILAARTNLSLQILSGELENAA